MGQKLTQPEEIDRILLVEGSRDSQVVSVNSYGNDLSRVVRVRMVNVHIPPYRAAYMRSHPMQDSGDNTQVLD